MSKAFVAIIMGSDSDLPTMEKTLEVLKQFEIPYEVRVASAHRTPDLVASYVTDAEQRGCAVFIGAAGMAAHLAGAIAARTTRPVIGVPCKGGIVDGVDALYSTVQMPGGIPVATVAVGSAGAKNAAYLAAQILSLSDPELDKRVKADRQKASEAILKKNEALQERLGKLD
ncbi:MAG: 5-(carboxyamino)imidazole ribonucleotide mutase [Succinivibrio sp.]|nr:5-(carboxyamino)imidazole ribonucleotide mutase [Succinivibrio sp.]